MLAGKTNGFPFISQLSDSPGFEFYASRRRRYLDAGFGSRSIGTNPETRCDRVPFGELRAGGMTEGAHGKGRAGFKPAPTLWANFSLADAD
jgi:hypothetical protein